MPLGGHAPFENPCSGARLALWVKRPPNPLEEQNSCFCYPRTQGRRSSTADAVEEKALDLFVQLTYKNTSVHEALQKRKQQTCLRLFQYV